MQREKDQGKTTAQMGEETRKGVPECRGQPGRGTGLSCHQFINELSEFWDSGSWESPVSLALPTLLGRAVKQTGLSSNSSGAPQRQLLTVWREAVQWPDPSQLPSQTPLEQPVLMFKSLASSR